MNIKFENVTATLKIGSGAMLHDLVYGDHRHRKEDKSVGDFEILFGLGLIDINLEPSELPELVKAAAKVVKAETEAKIVAKRSEKERKVE